MIYLSKGVVIRQSTEEILKIAHCGQEFTLTGKEADMWLNGRFDFAGTDSEAENGILDHLCRMGLAERSDGMDTADRYRILTQCVICPAVRKGLHRPLPPAASEILTWLTKAGLRLTMAELTFLHSRHIRPEPELLSDRQKLVERLYARETISDNTLENLMEHESCRDEMVDTVLLLLRKKHILLL